MNLQAPIIDPSDFIFCNSWAKIAKELNCLYIQQENVAEFMRHPTVEVANKGGVSHHDMLPIHYVLLSGYSDFGIHEQALSHPNRDLVKMSASIDFRAIAAERNEYINIDLSAIAGKAYCDNADKYSVKIDRYTIGTFPGIPSNIHWFCSNLDIFHPQCTWVPFGIGVADFQDDIGPALSLIIKYRNEVKRNGAYVNFSNTSYQRMILNAEGFRLYAEREDCTYITNPLSQEEYLRELSGHLMCLCPFGNGLDSYRLWECLYLGVVPIIENSVFAQHIVNAGLPAVIVETMYKLPDSAYLMKEYQNIVSNLSPRWADALKLSVWRSRIEDAAKRLTGSAI